MYVNDLSRLLGINKNNFKNQEYVLQVCTEYSTLDISFDELKEIIEKSIKESKVFTTVMQFDELGKFILNNKSFEQLNIIEKDITNEDSIVIEEEIRKDVSWLEEDSYLYRCVLAKNLQGNYVRVFLAFHHSIMDGVGIFNFLERIQKRIAGDVVDTYEDGNEHTFLDEIIEKNGNYWEPKIKKYEDSICTKAIENLGTIELVFTKEENKRIKNAKKDIMMATLLGIARTYPIFDYNNSSDIIIDFASNLRKRRTVNELGMYVNIMPIFADKLFDNTLSEAELVLRKSLIGIFKHVEYPVNEVGKTFSNIMFSYVPLSQYKCLNKYFVEDRKFTWLDTGRGPYDFAYSLFDGEDYVRLRIDYKINKFSHDEMQVYIKWLKDYVVNYLTMEQSKKDETKLSEWVPEIFNRSIIQNELNDVSFEELLNDTFNKNLNRVAFTDGTNSITYGEVAHSIKKIAAEYEERIKDCEVIFIYGKPNLEMFVIMVTAIYLGIPYIFSGPKIPIKTVQYLNKEFKNIFFSNTELDEIEVEPYPKLVYGKTEEICFDNPGHDLLTYFCTSGTTGESKIIPDKRTGIANLINNKSNTYIEEGDTSLLISSVTFDLTIDPIYRSLLKGGTIVIVEIEKLFNKNYLLDLVEKTGADTLLGTPSALSGICNEVYKKLTKVGSVGEILTKSLANRLNSFDNIRLFNCYGPTEATCYCHLVEITGETYNDIEQEVSIGYVIDGMESIIVDPFDCEIPDGLQGEMLLAGVGVLDDYYNYKGTDKVFTNVYGRHWYHSGDMCRVKNGLYYYIARKGKQVKINGYRVELSTIEKKLENYLTSAFKLMLINGILVVFHEGEIVDVQNRMLNELPSYMVPKKFICVEKLPTNKNQKVNTKLLEEMYKENANTYVDYSEMNSIEKYIYKIFADILGISNFGLDDSLYELGGNSFTIIQISNKLKEKYSCIDFEIVMEYMNVRKLAKYISKNQDLSENYNFVYDIVDEFKVNNMQKSMILKQIMNPKDTSYHIGALISVENMKVTMEEIMDYCKKENEFHYNVAYHDNEFYLKYREEFKPAHNKIEISRLDEISNTIVPFDLFKDTLIRYSDVVINGELKYYLFEMHHIISDGFTLQSALIELLDNKKADKRVALWSALEYFSEKEKKSIEESIAFITNLKEAKPSKFIIPKQDKTVQKHYKFDKDSISTLLKCVRENSLSVQSCISSLIVNALIECKYIDEQDKCIVGTPVNLRNCVELENAYGPLIQMLPTIVTSGIDAKSMEKTKNAISETLKNKFVPYDHIVKEYGKNLFELVITSFRKYDNLSNDEYNQNIAIYPDKFGSTMFIYEGNNEIELVLSSYYLDYEMMDNIISKVKNKIKSLGKVE